MDFMYEDKNILPKYSVRNTEPILGMNTAPVLRGVFLACQNQRVALLPFISSYTASVAVFHVCKLSLFN